MRRLPSHDQRGKRGTEGEGKEALHAGKEKYGFRMMNADKQMTVGIEIEIEIVFLLPPAGSHPATDGIRPTSSTLFLFPLDTDTDYDPDPDDPCQW